MGKTIQLSSQKSSVTPSPQPTPKPAPVPVKNPWAKVNQVVVNNENKNAFPSLADVGQKDKETLKKELEQIRQESLLQVAKAEEEEKARKAKILERHETIQKLATREYWWSLLHLNDGTNANTRVRDNYSQLANSTRVHITVVKSKTTHPNLQQDSAATIVNKILGEANVADSVHATAEKNGKVDPDNPKYYRNGDAPKCNQNESVALGAILAAFINDATELATNMKAQYG